MLKCGLLGEKLGHSYSPRIHAELGDYEYKLYEKSPAELPDFLRFGDFHGLNVTIPYKKTVIPYCAALSDEAAAIGSVNTLLRRTDGSLFGDNTDAFGFRKMVEKSGISVRGKKALIFGSGGASVTVRAVLTALGAGKIVTISRSGEDNYTNLDRHADAQVLINATPLGMYPENGAAPVSLRDFPRCEAVLDVVYNPSRTALLLEAEELGIPRAGGLTMLVQQAIRASELFTGNTVDPAEAERIEGLIRGEMENVILIGMPGCGKTTAGKLLAEKLRRPFADCDSYIEERSGMSIPAIFAAEGEAGFRKRETEALAELCKQSGTVIATGGGCVTVEANYPLLHQNGVIVYITRDLPALPTEGRPLSQSNAVEELFEKRKHAYARFADVSVENRGSKEELLNAVMEVLP